MPGSSRKIPVWLSVVVLLNCDVFDTGGRITGKIAISDSGRTGNDRAPSGTGYADSGGYL